MFIGHLNLPPADHGGAGAGRAGQETEAGLQGGAAHLRHVHGQLRTNKAVGGGDQEPIEKQTDGKGRGHHFYRTTGLVGRSLLTSRCCGARNHRPSAWDLFIHRTEGLCNCFVWFRVCLVGCFLLMTWPLQLPQTSAWGTKGQRISLVKERVMS